MHKKKTSSNLSYPMFSGGEKNSCSAFVLSAIVDFHFSRNTLIFPFLLDFTLWAAKGSIFLPWNFGCDCNPLSHKHLCNSRTDG